jgi:hypothetical protein
VRHRLNDKIRPATINNSLRALRRALHLARDWRLLAHVPKIKMVPGETARKFVFSEIALDNFLSHARKSTLSEF